MDAFRLESDLVLFPVFLDINEGSKNNDDAVGPP
jgi:hypothetical protein